MDHEGSVGGDEQFAGWYNRHHDRIRALCSHLLRDPSAAEDIAQETLLRAWIGRDRMREDVGAWLSVVARNLCVSHLRRQNRVVPLELLPDLADETADPARAVERLESRRAVRKAMREVAERHRTLLLRREVEEVDYEELGAELGMTAGGARTMLFRVRRVLRERLAAVGEGVGAWIFGFRVRVSRWNRQNPVVVESAAGPMLQAGLSLVLAVGLAAAPVAGARSRAPIVGGSALPSLSWSVNANKALLDTPSALTMANQDPAPGRDQGNIGRFREENLRVERDSDFHASVPAPDGETKLIEIGEYSQPGPENHLPYEGSKRQAVWDYANSLACATAPDVCNAVFTDP